jgi:cell division transport system permease protein
MFFVYFSTLPPMTSNKNKSGSKARSSSISTIVGISLVLFMLGTLSFVLLNAKKLSDHVKKSFRIQVFINDDINDAEILKLQKLLEAEFYVSDTDYITKEDAVAIMQDEIGEDFVSFLGYNPLQASLDLHLEPDFAHPDSLIWIEKAIHANSIVKEVVYQPDLIELVNKNIRRISMVVLGFSVLLLIIAIALINNTIRLAIFSKRFLIRSMQLVGATRGFIMRPFIWHGIAQGLWAAVIALGLIGGVLYASKSEIPELMNIQDLNTLVQLFGLVVLLGILISVISTIFAVNKYLNSDLDKLY